MSTKLLAPDVRFIKYDANRRALDHLRECGERGLGYSLLTLPRVENNLMNNTLDVSAQMKAN